MQVRLTYKLLWLPKKMFDSIFTGNKSLSTDPPKKTHPIRGASDQHSKGHGGSTTKDRAHLNQGENLSETASCLSLGKHTTSCGRHMGNP